MHKVGGILYYDPTDSKQLMADIYYLTVVNHTDPAIRKGAKQYMAAFYNTLNTNGTEVASEILNVRITEGYLPRYEKHWLKLLSAYGLNPRIHMINGVEAASGIDLCSMIGIEHQSPRASEMVSDYLKRHTSERWLVLNLLSTVKSPKGKYAISKNMVDVIKEGFDETVVDMDTKDLCIRYAPTPDIGTAIYLTDILHHYL